MDRICIAAAAVLAYASGVHTDGLSGQRSRMTGGMSGRFDQLNGQAVGVADLALRKLGSLHLGFTPSWWIPQARRELLLPTGRSTDTSGVSAPC